MELLAIVFVGVPFLIFAFKVWGHIEKHGAKDFYKKISIALGFGLVVGLIALSISFLEGNNKSYPIFALIGIAVIMFISWLAIRVKQGIIFARNNPGEAVIHTLEAVGSIFDGAPMSQKKRDELRVMKAENMVRRMEEKQAEDPHK